MIFSGGSQCCDTVGSATGKVLIVHKGFVFADLAQTAVMLEKSPVKNKAVL